MSKNIKPQVSMEDTFDRLDIRVGRVTAAVLEETAPKRAYKLTIDFGRYGIKTSVGRFTQADVSDIEGRQVLGVLNFPPRQVGHVTSEVLILGVQYPKAASGEAAFVTPAVTAKIGSKLF